MDEFHIPRFSQHGPDCDLSPLPGIDQLSDQQTVFLYAALYGRLNILLTGSAGVGKTFVLKLFREACEKLGRRVQFTSTTGVSATDLPNGMTLHAWFQMGLAEGNPRQVAARAASKQQIKETILKLDCLVIDEVSMLSARFLEAIELTCQLVHKCQLPWGGKLQVILCADFSQCKCVNRSHLYHQMAGSEREGQQRAWSHIQDMSEESRLYLHNLETLTYCFQHPEWDRMIDCVISLEQVFRQTDKEFVELLNRIRFGRHTSADVALLKAKCKDMPTHMDRPIPTAKEFEHAPPIALRMDPDAPVHMFAINKKVDEMNARELKYLAPDSDFKEYKYKSRMSRTNPFNRQMFTSWVEDQKTKCLAQPTIRLTVGCRVMLVANLDVSQGLANGSMGLVVGFTEKSRPPSHEPQWPIVRFKKQGMNPHSQHLIQQSDTLDNLLSTCKSKTPSESLPMPSKRVKIEEGIKVENDAVLKSLDTFAYEASNDCNYQDVVIYPHIYKYEDESSLYSPEDMIEGACEPEDGEQTRNEQKEKDRSRKRKYKDSANLPCVTYEQIPLKIAYALSIHKTQGKTLSRCTIDAGDIWDEGLFYVALSRCKSLDGIELYNFHPKCIRANPIMVAYYDSLKQDNQAWMSRLEQLRESLKESSSVAPNTKKSIDYKAMTMLIREFHLKRQARSVDISRFFQNKTKS